MKLTAALKVEHCDGGGGDGGDGGGGGDGGDGGRVGRGDGGDSQTWKSTQHVTIRKVFTNDTAYKGLWGRLLSG